MAAWKDGLTITSCVIALLFLVGMAIYTWIKWRRREIEELRKTQEQVHIRKISRPDDPERQQNDLPTYTSVMADASEPTIVVENNAPRAQRGYQNQALEVRSVGDLSARARKEQEMNRNDRGRAATAPAGQANGLVDHQSEKTWL